MMNNNKILTVSYGTFSCTLEGFDDSFGTMKAIAEYFRDLASDDRYFGAEPPQPDAEMLARIAQREVARKVEAHERDGKIVLSALGSDTSGAGATAVAPVALAGLAATQTDAAVEPAPFAAEIQNDTAPATEQAVPHPSAEPEIVQAEDTPDTVAADPAEEAAQTAVQADDASHEYMPYDPTDQSATNQSIANQSHADQHTDQSDSASAADAPQTRIDQPETDIVPGQPDEEVEAFFEQADDAPQTPAIATEPAPEATVLDAVPSAVSTPDAPDSIAAKLQRIRAVVAQNDDEEEEDFSEDEHASAAQDRPADTAQTVVADARRDIEDALDADAPADVSQSETDLDNAEGGDEDDVDDIADILRRLEGGAEPDTGAPRDTETRADDAENAPASPPMAEDHTDPLHAYEDDGIALDNVFEDDTVPASPDTNADAETQDAAQTEATVANVVATNGLQVAATPLTEPAEGAKPHRARVIKVKRADLEAAIQSGNLEEYDEDSDETPKEATTNLDDLAPARTAQTSLSAQDEDELARELAALDAEMQDAPETAPEDAEPAEFEDAMDLEEDPIAATLASLEDETEGRSDDVMGAALSSARSKLPNIGASQDADVSRLLAEADSQMDEPESATRRDAFAHLRAAVAAKKADDALGVDESASQDDAYRNDLADVVRPRRPVAGEAQTPRPGEGRPAPLKLVAEQRIDVEDSIAPTGPVSPRRVARSPEQVEAADSSFAEFAAEAGATKLPDLLEAAAAYLSFVEGHDKFSRPQLMNKVRQVGTDGFTREDTLRSFGKLLREGKIEKIKTGQFSASEDIGFQPSRQAG